MKYLLTLLSVTLLSVVSFAGVARFSVHHVVKPAAKVSAKAAQKTSHVAKKAAKVAKKAVY